MKNALSLYVILGWLMISPFSTRGEPFFIGALGSEENPPIYTISLCVDPDWEPFEQINQKGEYKGIAADLITLIGQRANIRFELIPTQNWEQSLEYSKEGRCQALAFLNQTSEREEWLIFTQPYFTEYNVFITREEHDYISDPAVLSGKKIALPRGTSIEEIIRERYPDLTIILTEDEKQAFQKVSNRRADMTLRSLTMAAWVIRKEGWFNLKIAGQLPGFTNELAIGLLADLHDQRNLIDQTIATLSPQEIQNVINQHVSIEVLRPYNYTLIKQISVALFIIFIVGLFWNLQLRRLNKKLEQKQKQLSGIISNLPGFIYRCKHSKEYNMFYITDACTEITGYSPAAFLENMVTFGEIILKEETEIIDKKWQEALANKTHFQHEYRITHADGTIRWLWERGHGVFDDKANLLFLEGFINDITLRKKAEIDLRDSLKKQRLLAERYQAFIEATNTGAWEYNIKTDTLWCSPQYFGMLGRNMDDYDLSTPKSRQITWENIIHPEDFPRTNAYLQEYLKNQEGNYEQVFRMIHQNGSSVWILSRGKNLTGHKGQPGGIIVGTHIDITKQKKAEEMVSAKNKELESFLYVASHDLRSPLVNVQGFSNRIDKNIGKLTDTINGSPEAFEKNKLEIQKIISETIPNSLSIIYSNVDKMNDLINGLLTISRTGRVKMDITECNIRQLMSGIIKTLAFQLESVRAQIELSDDIHNCYGDEKLLNQLFSNIIDNAIKYRKPNEILTIKIRSQLNRNNITYSIEDNGIGISERSLNKIWDVFYRVDPHSEQKGEGIGLNLAAKIIEKHKGMIWAKSEIDKGSTFFIQLPSKSFSETI